MPLVKGAVAGMSRRGSVEKLVVKPNGMEHHDKPHFHEVRSLNISINSKHIFIH